MDTSTSALGHKHAHAHNRVNSLLHIQRTNIAHTMHTHIHTHVITEAFEESDFERGRQVHVLVLAQLLTHIHIQRTNNDAPNTHTHTLTDLIAETFEEGDFERGRQVHVLVLAQLLRQARRRLVTQFDNVLNMQQTRT